MKSKNKRKLEVTRRAITQDDILECFCHSDIVSSLNELQMLFSDKTDDDIARLLTSTSLIRLFNVSLFWMIHLRGILHFSLFLSKVDKKCIIEMLKALSKTKDALQLEIFDTIILHIFTDYCNENDRSSCTGHTCRQKCFDILDEVCMEYTSIYPVALTFSDMERMTRICNSIMQSENTADMQSFYTHLLTRMLSATYTYFTAARPATSAVSAEVSDMQESTMDDELSLASSAVHEFIASLPPSVGVEAIERVLREDYHCPFDYSTCTTIRRTCGSSSCPLMCLLLPCTTVAPHHGQRLSLCSPNAVLSICAHLAGVGMDEANSMYLLRALCLVDTIGGFQLVASFISSLCAQWSSPSAGPPAIAGRAIDVIPKDTQPGDDGGGNAGNRCVESLKDFTYVCLSLCEAVGVMPLGSLRAACHVIRAKRETTPDCKDPADSFLQAARCRLKHVEKLNLVLRDGGRGMEEPISELTPSRLRSWADTTRHTCQLPVAIVQLCNFLGRNAHKKILSSMFALAAKDKSLREPCEVIVTGMAQHSPSLCPVGDMNEFVKHLRRKGSSLEEKVHMAYLYVLYGTQDHIAQPSVSQARKSGKLEDSISGAIRIGVSIGEYMAGLKSKFDTVVDNILPTREAQGASNWDRAHTEGMPAGLNLSKVDVVEVCQQWVDSCAAAFTACGDAMLPSSHGNRTGELRLRLAGVLSLSALQIAERVYLCISSQSPLIGRRTSPITSAAALLRDGGLMLTLASEVLSVFCTEAFDMQESLYCLMAQALEGVNVTPCVANSDGTGVSEYSLQEDVGEDLVTTGWSLALIDTEVTRIIIKRLIAANLSSHRGSKRLLLLLQHVKQLSVLLLHVCNDLPTLRNKDGMLKVAGFIDVCYLYITSTMRSHTTGQRRIMGSLYQQADACLVKAFPLSVATLHRFLQSDIARWLVGVEIGYDRIMATEIDCSSESASSSSACPSQRSQRSTKEKQKHFFQVWKCALMTLLYCSADKDKADKTHSTASMTMSTIRDEPLEVLNVWRALHTLLDGSIYPSDFDKDKYFTPCAMDSVECIVIATFQCLDSCCGVKLTTDEVFPLLEDGIGQLLLQSHVAGSGALSYHKYRHHQDHIIRLMMLVIIEVCSKYDRSQASRDTTSSDIQLLPKWLVCVELVWNMGTAEEIATWRTIYERMCDVDQTIYDTRCFSSCHLLASFEMTALLTDFDIDCRPEPIPVRLQDGGVGIQGGTAAAPTASMVDLTVFGANTFPKGSPSTCKGSGVSTSLVERLYRCLLDQFMKDIFESGQVGDVFVNFDQLWTYAWAFPNLLYHLHATCAHDEYTKRRVYSSGEETTVLRAVDATISLLRNLCVEGIISLPAPNIDINELVSQFCVYGCAACVYHSLRVQRRPNLSSTDTAPRVQQSMYAAIANSLLGSLEAVKCGKLGFQARVREPVTDSEQSVLTALASYFPSTRVQELFAKILDSMLSR